MCINLLQSVFIKDSNSLGFYNVTSTTVVQLGLKERGGRKKYSSNVKAVKTSKYYYCIHVLYLYFCCLIN